MRKSIFLGAVGLSSGLAVCMVTATAAPADIIVRKVDIGAFTSVGISGSIESQITVGPAQSIVLRGPKAQVDNLEVVLKDDALMIRRKKSSWMGGYTEGTKAIITVPSLQKVAVSGSGNMTVSGVKAQDFGIATSGSGDIRASGSCTTVRTAVSGSGAIDATGLKCSSAKVSIAGSGDNDVFATRDITVAIAGSGDVRVLGAPSGACSVKIAGSGSVAMPGRTAGKCTSSIAGSGDISY